jgi:hypothetical protein
MTLTYEPFWTCKTAFCTHSYRTDSKDSESFCWFRRSTRSLFSCVLTVEKTSTTIFRRRNATSSKDSVSAVYERFDNLVSRQKFEQAEPKGRVGTSSSSKVRSLRHNPSDPFLVLRCVCVHARVVPCELSSPRQRSLLLYPRASAYHRCVDAQHLLFMCFTAASSFWGAPWRPHQSSARSAYPPFWFRLFELLSRNQVVETFVHSGYGVFRGSCISATEYGRRRLLNGENTRKKRSSWASESTEGFRILGISAVWMCTKCRFARSERFIC